MVYPNFAYQKTDAFMEAFFEYSPKCTKYNWDEKRIFLIALLLILVTLCIISKLQECLLISDGSCNRVLISERTVYGQVIGCVSTTECKPNKQIWPFSVAIKGLVWFYFAG